ncbi:MAG: carboxypeptidase-like regulatory domain-containing protein [Candidatus Latescibacterota bacterium]
MKKTFTIHGGNVDAGIVMGGYVSKNIFVLIVRVADETGRPLRGTTLHVTGEAFAKDLLLRDKDYADCTLKFGKTYTVVPEKAGYSYSFTPEKYELTSPDTVTVCTFTARYTGSPLHSISGRIIDKQGNPVKGMMVLQGDAHPSPFHVDSSGRFMFSELRDNNYTLTLHGDFALVPEELTVTVAGRYIDLGDLKCPYDGPTNYYLSGRVIDQNGAGMPDITIAVHPPLPWGYAKTDVDGYFQKEIRVGDSEVMPDQYTVGFQPQKEGWEFTPDSTFVTLLWKPEVIDGGAVTIPTFTGRAYPLFTPADYFPLRSTSTWTYERTVGDGQPIENRVSISGERVFEGLNYQVFSPDGPAGYTAFRVEENKVLALRDSRKAELLRFGFGVTPGYTWPVGKTDYLFQITGTFLGLETVTVSAGTWSDCLKFNLKASLGDPNYYEQHILWFARGIGMVKSERKMVKYGVEQEQIVDVLKGFTR